MILSTLVFLISPLACYAQVRATLTQVPISGTAAIFGKHAKGAAAGLWVLSLEPLEAPPLSVPRARVISAFPEIPLLPNMLGQDLIDARVAQDPRTVSNALWGLFKKLGPAAATVAGLATKTDGATYIGLGAGALLQIADLIVQSRQPPNPRSRYYPLFCPDTGANAALGLGSAWIVPDAGMECYLTSATFRDPPRKITRIVERPAMTFKPIEVK